MSDSKGLGDSIEKITKATGIKKFTKLAMQVAGVEDCGCNDRQNWLNRQFPYYK